MTFSRTWIEVNLPAIAANAEAIKAHTGTCLIAVIKADAYGHGAVRVAQTLHEIADMFAVATMEEGAELRDAGIRKPILILFSPLPELAAELVAYRLTPAIDNWQLAQRLVDAVSNSQFAVHVEINTGMNRSGVHWTEAKAFLDRLKTLKRLEIGGVFTHFATADDVDKSYAYLQLERFSALLDKLMAASQAEGEASAYREGSIVHAANSAATLTLPEARFDAVRPGLSLYGIYPLTEKPIPLQPALAWKTRIGWVGWIEAGEGVSYGITYRAPHRTRIAMLQVGYGDGYPRELSNPPSTVARGPVPRKAPPLPSTVARGPVPRNAPIGGEVLIGGKRRPIVGRICMDATLIQLEPSDDVSIGDEAVLIGKQGDAELGIDEVAARAGTISYHILTQISRRVARNYKPL